MEAPLFISESQAMMTPLYRIGYSILRSRADAEDAVQQGLMKAWAARERVAPEKFRAWVTRIVVNECRNIQRHRRRVALSADVAADQAFIPPDPDVMDAVYELQESLRVPFAMKYIARYTEKEIGEALRLPVSTIKNRLARARRLLRDKLSDSEVMFE